MYYLLFVISSENFESKLFPKQQYSRSSWFHINRVLLTLCFSCYLNWTTRLIVDSRMYTRGEGLIRNWISRNVINSSCKKQKKKKQFKITPRHVKQLETLSSLCTYMKDKRGWGRGANSPLFSCIAKPALLIIVSHLCGAQDQVEGGGCLLSLQQCCGVTVYTVA